MSSKAHAFLVVFAIVSLPTSALAIDPSFNGILALEQCQINMIAACGSGYCADLNPATNGIAPVANFILNFHAAPMIQYMFTREIIDVVEVSEAALNKPLWVKFKFPSEHAEGAIARIEGTVNGLLSLVPGPYPTGFLREVGLSGKAKMTLEPGLDSLTMAGGCVHSN